MNTKEYIASGVLENYVLGLLSEKEQLTVEQVVAQYPEVKRELNAIEDALCQYLQATARPLPDGLKASTLAKITDLEKATPHSTSSFNSMNWLLGLAAIILGGFGAYLSNKNNDLKEQLTITENNFTLLKIDCDQQAQKMTTLEEQLAILRDTSLKTTFMRSAGNGKAPQAIAAVYNNTEEKKTYLDIINLPEVPAGKQYQLWALVDGVPVDMGVFDLVIEEDSTFIEVPFIENAGAFAVTLEDEGGKPTPDLTQLYVIGNV